MAGSSAYRLPALALLAAIIVAACGYVAGVMRSESAHRAELAHFALTQTNLSVGVLMSLDGGRLEQARRMTVSAMEQSLQRLQRYERAGHDSEREQFTLNTLHRAAQFRRRYPPDGPAKQAAQVEAYLRERLDTSGGAAR